MKKILLLAAVALVTACSSAPKETDASKMETIKAVGPHEKSAASSAGASSAKPFTPTKAMKCKYDTDCVVPDSCVANKCKLGGNECRFRSDCPSPRGTCVANKCEFH